MGKGENHPDNSSNCGSWAVRVKKPLLGMANPLAGHPFTNLWYKAGFYDL